MKQLDKVEIGRMRQLADFLETVPPSKFDIRRWETEEFVPAQTFLFGLIQLEPECGFAGCAMGWAAHSKLFDGLCLDPWDRGLVYKGFTQFYAAAKVFGIKKAQAEYLFAGDCYKKKSEVEPGDVAARLNKFADKVENRLKRSRYVAPKLQLVA